jgi:hypothetical protein
MFLWGVACFLLGLVSSQFLTYLLTDRPDVWSWLMDPATGGTVFSLCSGLSWFGVALAAVAFGVRSLAGPGDAVDPEEHAYFDGTEPD